MADKYEKLAYWNPNFPVMELPHLDDTLRHHLRSDGYRTVEKLDCPKEQLLRLGYDGKMVRQIRAALNKHRRFVENIEAIFEGENLGPKQAEHLWPFDLLRLLPFTCAQLGYILCWQRDIAGRYGEKEMFCIVGGRVYYCTTCPYRNELSNFCGVCYRKLLDDIREEKHHGI